MQGRGVKVAGGGIFPSLREGGRGGMMNHHPPKGLIIMTRTTIITADGTRLREEGAGKALIRRGLIWGLILIASLFTIAALIGFGKAIFAPTHTPTDNSVSTFNDGWDTGLSDILQIGNSPAGRAKIDSCMISSKNVDAFHSCIDR